MSIPPFARYFFEYAEQQKIASDHIKYICLNTPVQCFTSEGEVNGKPVYYIDLWTQSDSPALIAIQQLINATLQKSFGPPVEENPDISMTPQRRSHSPLAPMDISPDRYSTSKVSEIGIVAIQHSSDELLRTLFTPPNDRSSSTFSSSSSISPIRDQTSPTSEPSFSPPSFLSEEDIGLLAQPLPEETTRSSAARFIASKDLPLSPVLGHGQKSAFTQRPQKFIAELPPIPELEKIPYSPGMPVEPRSPGDEEIIRPSAPLPPETPESKMPPSLKMRRKREESLEESNGKKAKADVVVQTPPRRWERRGAISLEILEPLFKS